eukprot:SAG31_NODE_2393_length_5793_cov_18.326484_6_plen_465_part_00
MPVPAGAWSPIGPGSPILIANLTAATGETDFGALPEMGSSEDGCDQLELKKTELFHGDTEMTLARYPNVASDGRWQFLHADPNGGLITGFAYSGCAYGGKNCNRTLVERLGGWSKEQDLRVHGYWVRDWADSIVKVADVAVQNHTAVVTVPSAMQGDFKNGNHKVDGNARFFGLNILSELDTPGEYYIDSRGMIYYWPEFPQEQWSDMPVISASDVAVTLDGVSYVSLEGVKIAHAKTVGVMATNVTNVVVKNCTIWGCGAKGVVIDDAKSSGLVDSHIFATGCGGAVVSGGNFTTLEPGLNFARGNSIHDVSNYKRSYQPGLLWAGVNNTYKWNHISEGPHNCILGGGNQGPGANNLFEFNTLERCAFESADTGAQRTLAQHWLRNKHVAVLPNGLGTVLNPAIRHSLRFSLVLLCILPLFQVHSTLVGSNQTRLLIVGTYFNTHCSKILGTMVRVAKGARGP